MNFINNWVTTLYEDMSAGRATLPVAFEAMSRLGVGKYRLTLTDQIDIMAQSDSVEIIEISIDSEGGHIVSRGLEGTAAQNWPPRTYVYASLTAGHMRELYDQIEWANNVLDGGATSDEIEALEQQVAHLQQQVAHLQQQLSYCNAALDDCLAGGGVEPSGGALVDGNNNSLTDSAGNYLTASGAVGWALTDQLGNTLTDENSNILTGG